VGAGVFKAKPLQFMRCSPTIAPMNTSKTPSKLTRAQVSQALDSVPVSHLLGKSATRELTGKQKRFALEVAKGSSGAEAYRTAYNTKALPKTQGNQAHKLKARPDISAEIEAYKLALESETYRTPAGLRSLIIQSLVQTIIDPDTPPAVRVQAAKVAGQITEVAAFTERKEVRTITSSEDARAKIMQELKQLTSADVQDVTVNDDADSLLAELAISVDDETHPHPTHQDGDEESRTNTHTIPHERSSSELDPQERSAPDSIFSDPEDPPPSTEETPPSSA
jgi:hypothetical protein